MRGLQNKPIHTSLQLTSPPADQPLDLDTVKLYLRVEVDDDDTLIVAMIDAARRYCENYTQRAFVTQSWLYQMDSFPWPWGWSSIAGSIQLPKPPVQSVESVQYLDQAGNLQTLDPSKYIVDTASEPARITSLLYAPWPTTCWMPGAVQVSFTCGYGSADFVPDSITQAMQLYITWLNANRGDQATSTEPPSTIKALLNVEAFR